MDEQQIDQKFIKAKKKKKIGINLLCWPLIVFLLWLISSLIFWYIDRYVGSTEQVLLIKSKVNRLFGILLLLYVFILPAGIALTVDANSDLKFLNKNNSVK